MSLDAIYADGIEQGLNRWAANPGPAPEPSFSVTSFLGAGAKGLPSGALEASGSMADLLSAFGTAAAASGGSAGGMFSVPTEAEQKQEADARKKMLEGNSFDFAAGNALRSKAAEFAPDPLTSHVADQVVHGLVRFGAKAVGATALAGPSVGAALLGLEEGNTAAQGLRTEGVDDATAAKVGAVQGVVAAAGVRIPMAGKTIAQTIGLVGVGGPGSYMAQEHLSRRILEEAGYNDQASLHNPFDPLGLSLSTVIPGAFGAFHLRSEFKRADAVKAGTVPLEQLRPEELRAMKYDDPRLDTYASTTAEKYGVPPALLLAVKNAGEKSGPTAVSGKGATGVMQFMKGTADEMGLKDRTDPLASIDAGARYLKKLYNAYGSWDAAVTHYNGGGAQAAIVRGGGRPTAKETIGYLDRVQQYVAQHTAQDAAKVPEAVDAARVSALNTEAAKGLPDTPDAYAQVQRAADIVGESGGRQAEQVIPPAIDFEVEMGALRAEIAAQSQEVARLQTDSAMPAGARTITNKAGDVFYDTRGAGERFHGTSNEVSSLSDDYALAGDNRNIYGQGFYTTDAADISNGYMKKGRGNSPVLYKVTEKGTPKLFDMEAPLTADLKAKAEEIFGALYRDTDVNGKDIKSLRELYDEVRAESQGEGYSRDDVQEMFDAMRHNLEQAGYDGFAHVGGAKTGNRAHGVNIYWTPEKHVDIEKADIAAYRAPQRDDAAIAQLAERANELSRRYVELKAQKAAYEATRTDSSVGNSLPPADSVTLAGDEPATRGAEVGKPQSGQETASGADGAEASVDTLLAQKLAAEQPDLQVVLPGSDERITAAEAMKRIAEEQKQDGQWADLVKVAAECALGA